MKWKYIGSKEVRRLLKGMRPLFVYEGRDCKHSDYSYTGIKRNFGSKTNLYNLLVIGLYIFTHLEEFGGMIEMYHGKSGKCMCYIPWNLCFGREITIEFYDEAALMINVYISKKICELSSNFFQFYYYEMEN